MNNGAGRQRVMLKRIPMVGVFISLAGGVVAGRYLYFTPGLLGVVMALGLICAAVGLYRPERRRLAVLGVLVCMAGVGAFRMELFWRSVPRSRHHH